MTTEDAVARIAELEADNRRLRLLLDQRDAPEELRHRLRGTLAMLRSVIRRSRASKIDIDAYAAHLEDRLEALMRTHTTIDEYGLVDLHTMLADEMFFYRVNEDDRVFFEGQQIEFRPRPALVMAMAVHELTVNAVEHGVLGFEAGKLSVGWNVLPSDNGRVFSLIWKERGAGSAPKEEIPRRRGFGTEVLTDMLRFELKAHTVLDYDKGAFDCRIDMPFTEKVGRLDIG